MAAVRSWLLDLLARAFASPAHAAKSRLLPAPKQLRGFMLRADERPGLHNRTFPRTPAFAWRPVAGAKRYDFELATSEVGDEGAILWSSASLSAPIKTPATAVPVALPWITGSPYSDTFHRTHPWINTVEWRVRAVRRLYGDIPNGLPAVTYGPWSDVHVNFNPPALPGLMSTFGTVSGSVVSLASSPSARANELTPAFVWDGDTRDGQTYDLFRVAVFTDRDCVNRVYSGSVVGSPAWAPRVGSVIKLPGTPGELTNARSSSRSTAPAAHPC